LNKNYVIDSVFIVDKKSSTPLFLQRFGKNVPDSIWNIFGYLSTFDVFAKYIYSIGLVSENLQIHKLIFKGQNNETHFIISNNEVVAVIVIVIYTIKSEKYEKFIENKIKIITDKFEEMFIDEIKQHQNTNVYKKFEDICKNILKE